MYTYNCSLNKLITVVMSQITGPNNRHARTQRQAPRGNSNTHTHTTRTNTRGSPAVGANGGGGGRGGGYNDVKDVLIRRRALKQLKGLGPTPTTPTAPDSGGAVALGGRHRLERVGIKSIAFHEMSIREGVRRGMFDFEATNQLGLKGIARFEEQHDA